MLEKYNKYKNKLEEIYDNIAEDVKVRIKLHGMKREKKLSKFFLNLEKTKAVQGIIKKLEIENKEISDPNEIKEPFMNSISQTKISKKLITSQR